MSTEPQEMTTAGGPPPPADGGGRREVSGRQVAIAVGAILVLLVLFWFFFLRSGDDATETAAPPVDPGVTSPAPTDGPGNGNGGGKKDDKPPVETFEVFASKDPFEPLLTAGEGGAGATDTGETTDTGDTTTDTTGDTTDTSGEPTDTDGDGDIDADDDSAGTTPGGGGGSGGEDVSGHTVSVVSVNGNSGATVQVDGTVYEVAEGETFADNFELLSTSGECATMLFGDDQFTVCEGEEILK